MRILPITNYSYNTQPYKTPKLINYENSTNVSKQQGVDAVCFQGVKAKNKPLRDLLKYGVYDMYTGLRLLDSKYVEYLLQGNFFEKPLNKVIYTLERNKDAFGQTELGILSELKKVNRRKPEIKLDEALKILKKEHERKLLDAQQPIFDELIEKACDLPEDIYKNFIDLMTITNQRLSGDLVVLPFSPKEFIYKLQRVREEIRSKNNPKEIKAITTLIRSARVVYDIPVFPQKMQKRRLNRTEKLKNQMQKDVLKKNSAKFNILRELFENSAIKDNKELRSIFRTASAKIHGQPARTPFKRKEFMYDLSAVLSSVQDKKLVSEMIAVAHKLPMSTENVSAFIVKYANDTPNKIGYSLLKNLVGSIDHIIASNIGGKNQSFNFGLCSVYINSKKTNIPFNRWIKMHPETRQNCQKYIDRMIELYNKGIFNKVGLHKSYITDFAKTIYDLSPKKNRIVLDLSKLKA